MRALALLVSIGLGAGVAHADPAREKLTSAIIRMGRGDIEGARKNLEEAEDLSKEAAFLALVFRQRGILLHVEGRRKDTLLAFLEALYFDASIELSDREHRGEIVRLFDCARRLHEIGLNETAVRARYADRFEGPGWSCPDPRLEAPPSPPPPPPPERSLLASPVFWIVAAVVVAGGATTGVLLATTGGEPTYDGSTGVRFELSE